MLSKATSATGNFVSAFGDSAGADGGGEAAATAIQSARQCDAARRPRR